MLKMLNEEESEQEPWLTAFWKGNWANAGKIFWNIFSRGPHESFVFWSCPVDFRRRFLSLLSYQFSTFSPSLALNILQNKNIKQQSQPRKYPGSHTHLECNLKFLCRFIRVLKHMHGVMPLVRCDELFLVFCFHHPKNKKKLVFLSKN